LDFPLSEARRHVTDYKVQFEVFEGPLDLLLYLVKKEEVDIYRVNLTTLATQFLEYVEVMRQLDLDIAGEFLVMAATLMYIKSRELLPVDQQAQTAADEDEGEDPRWELIRRLVEYKKFKDAAAQLQTLEWQQDNRFPRAPAQPPSEPPPVPSDLSFFDLISAVTAILKRFQEREGPRDIFADRWTVSEKIELIRQVITRQPVVWFSELFERATSRSEVVVTFLALLELIRLKHVVVAQARPFAEIEVRAVALEPPAPAVLPEPPAADTFAS
jgi:segregation and condensation protein A